MDHLLANGVVIDTEKECYMRMLFNWDIEHLCVVFSWWRINSILGLVVSCGIVILIGMFYEYIRYLSKNYDKKLYQGGYRSVVAEDDNLVALNEEEEPRNKAPINSNNTSTPWTQVLEQSHKKNYRTIVYVNMTNIRRNGEPSSHNIRFQDFLKDDPRYLIFLMAFNDNSLHGDVKSNPKAILSWHMSTTKQIYTLSGRFYRFPPPKILSDELSNVPSQEYWESIRRHYWSSLSSQTRVVFTWPPSGEIPKANKEAFQCDKLESMLTTDNKKTASDDPMKIKHDFAFDNFCLLVFKVNEVVKFDYGGFPMTRVVYSFDEDSNTWAAKEANP
ncbi:6453_t:CDS:2 [Entrophospora sp. SA101]|nr:6453_t:CDS:2 [Entrophospora sp. SA101]CAJ0832121.1 3229_t:CDS:2 [Entrophospora sp. SA101]